jgi:L-cysteine/cystine lyase
LTFEQVRAEFPVLARFAYLNAGTFGPLSRSTAEAMAAQARSDIESGRGGQPYYDASKASRQHVRRLLAAELSVPTEHMALTYSTTDACNVVLAGLDIGPGDEIVTTDSEHFGLLGPLHASGATVRVAPVGTGPAADALDTILAETGPKTRLIAVSHVTWTTGQVLPLEGLKARTTAPLLVDGAQSVGAIPVDARPFDFYTVSGQKWLCGPDATGGLYVAEPDRLRVARPNYLSQTAYQPDGSFDPAPRAGRFGTGWIPPASLAGLAAALENRPDWRFERAREQAARCRELLLQAGYEVVTEPGQATLVSFRVEGHAAQIARHAFERGVVIRDIPGRGLLRASCGYWTSEEDLARLVESVSPA